MSKRIKPALVHVAGASPDVQPSDDDYRSVIDELLELHRAQDGIRVRSQGKYSLYVLHGLVEHAMRCSEAALILLERGMHAGAVPLARIAFEHALRAQWVHQHPEGLDAFVLAADQQQAKFLRASKTMAGINTEEIEQLLTRYGDAAGAPGAAHIFEQTCNAFDETGWFYGMYRLMSGFVHPGPATVLHYIAHPDLADEAAIELRREPAEVSNTMVLATLAMSAVFASAVYEDLRYAKPHKAVIRRAADRLGIMPLLKLRAVSS